MKQERRERIDHELQRELARLISTELKDPRLGFVTVTHVEITDDMQHAKVFVSIIGDRHVARQSMDALESAGGFLRGELGHVVRLRCTPDLTFIEDRSTERAIELSKTLAKIVPARPATTDEVVAELRRRSAFVMVSHVKPDGDTLGAGLALGLALRPLGKRVHYYQEGLVPRNLRFLPDADKVSGEVPADLPADALWVFGDMSDTGRAGEKLPLLEQRNILNIDHHLANTRFGALNYVLEKECSTGTCVMHLLRALKIAITPEIATCLLTTIMTDTGGFMHSNTTSEVLHLSADLIAFGADREEIANQIFANKRVAAMRLLGHALSTAQLDEDGRYCWTIVDDAMLAACGADGEDTEDIIQHLRAVDGVEVAALFKAFDNEVRVSLRGNGRVNVQAAAARLDGGGHFRASGLTYHGSVAQAHVAVREALRSEGL